MSEQPASEEKACFFCQGDGVIVRWNANGPVDESPCPFCNGSGEKKKDHEDG